MSGIALLGWELRGAIRNEEIEEVEEAKEEEEGKEAKEAKEVEEFLVARLLVVGWWG